MGRSRYEHVSFSLMRALSVKHFRADIPLFVHIMHHHDEFESHPLWEELSRYQNSTCVICVEDIKMEVPAHAFTMHTYKMHITALIADYFAYD